MTMHMSKGLEFDVVFALGLVNRTPMKEYIVPCLNNGKDVLMAVDKDSKEYFAYCQEVDAEKMRQLYVSMTRAKYRLYLPVVIDTSGKKVAFGTASPMELFLAPQYSYEKKYDHLHKYDKESFLNFINKLSKHVNITHTDLNESSINTYKMPEMSIPILNAPKKAIIKGKPCFINSFSSLSKENLTTQIDMPHDFNIENKTIHTLPSGQETGVILHEIFEKLPYNDLKSDSSIISFYISSMLQGSIFESWTDVFSDIVTTAYHMPLNKENAFSINDVSPNLLKVEMEFIFEDNQYCGIDEGFIKGFIDLFFQHENKYYLIDWKSNYLGPNIECYCQNNLFSAMNEHDYYLQSKLYVDAIRKYLNIVETIPFEECFGGVFYIFLRGLDIEKGPDFGIFKVPNKF